MSNRRITASKKNVRSNLSNRGNARRTAGSARPSTRTSPRYNRKPAPIARAGIGSGVSFPARIVIIVCSCILVVVIAFFATTQNRLTPKSTVKSFLFCAKHSYMKGMIKCIDPTEVAILEFVLGDSNTFSDNPQARRILSNFIEYDIYPSLDPVIVSSEKGHYKATIKVKVDINDEPAYFDFHMIKARGQWYIQYISPSEE